MIHKCFILIVTVAVLSSLQPARAEEEDGTIFRRSSNSSQSARDRVEFNLLEAKVTRLESNLQNSRREESRLSRELESAIKELDRTRKELKLLDKTVDRLEDSIRRDQRQIKDLEEELEKQEKYIKASHPSRSLKRKVAQLEDDVDELQRKSGRPVTDRAAKEKDEEDGSGGLFGWLKRHSNDEEEAEQSKTAAKPAAKTTAAASATKTTRPRATQQVSSRETTPPAATTSAPATTPQAAPPRARPRALTPNKYQGLSTSELIVKGADAQEENDIDTAEECYLAALEKAPNNTDVLLGLAQCYMARRDYKQADYTLAKVLKLQSGNVNAIMLSGWSALQQNDLRKATDQFEEAIERKPGSAQLHVYLAMVLDRREKKSAAVEELRKAIKIDPYNPEAQYNLSVLLATRKKTVQEARTCYERAIRLGHQPSTELEQILYR